MTRTASTLGWTKTHTATTRDGRTVPVCVTFYAYNNREEPMTRADFYKAATGCTPDLDASRFVSLVPVA